MRRLSLANKCLLLFGGAVFLVVVTSMLFPWFRMARVIEDGKAHAAWQLITAWEQSVRLDALPPGPKPWADGSIEFRPIGAERRASDSERLARIIDRAVASPVGEATGAVEGGDGSEEDAYIRALGAGQDQAIGVVIFRKPHVGGEFQHGVNALFLAASGSVVFFVAVLLFYLITSKLVLRPVRELKGTFDNVREGATGARSTIKTGDEFESLGDAFNAMLERLVRTERELRATNASLDLKLSEMAERNMALHEASRLKSSFLANVSHELRTPLNAIIGFAELLLDLAERDERASPSDESNPTLEKRRKYLENIEHAGRGLLELINDLLELARIEAGRVSIDISPVRLDDFLHTLAAMVKPLADRRSVRVVVEPCGQLPELRTDARKLTQIVFNLLSNAIKFSPDRSSTPGMGAEVRLRAEKLQSPGGADAGERVRISVLDQGAGIPPEQHERIFEKFRQLEGGPTRSHEGAGLGLAICKELATVLGGQMQVESAPNRGSMFSVVIPTELTEADAQETKLVFAFRGVLHEQALGTQATAGPDESSRAQQPID